MSFISERVKGRLAQQQFEQRMLPAIEQLMAVKQARIEKQDTQAMEDAEKLLTRPQTWKDYGPEEIGLLQARYNQAAERQERPTREFTDARDEAMPVLISDLMDNVSKRIGVDANGEISDLMAIPFESTVGRDFFSKWARDRRNELLAAQSQGVLEKQAVQPPTKEEAGAPTSAPTPPPEVLAGLPTDGWQFIKALAKNHITKPMTPEERRLSFDKKVQAYTLSKQNPETPPELLEKAEAVILQEGKRYGVDKDHLNMLEYATKTASEVGPREAAMTIVALDGMVRANPAYATDPIVQALYTKFSRIAPGEKAEAAPTGIPATPSAPAGQAAPTPQPQRVMKSVYHSQPVKVGEPLYVAGKPEGLVEGGNVDLHNRSIILNENRTYSTLLSYTHRAVKGEDGKWKIVPWQSTPVDAKFILVPGVSEDRQLTEEESAMRYGKRGEFLGVFNTMEQADAYARAVHDESGQKYAKPAGELWAKHGPKEKAKPTGVAPKPAAQGTAQPAQPGGIKVQPPGEKPMTEAQKQAEYDRQLGRILSDGFSKLDDNAQQKQLKRFSTLQADLYTDIGGWSMTQDKSGKWIYVPPADLTAKESQRMRISEERLALSREANERAQAKAAQATAKAAEAGIKQGTITTYTSQRTALLKEKQSLLRESQTTDAKGERFTATPDRKKQIQKRLLQIADEVVRLNKLINSVQPGLIPTTKPKPKDNPKLHGILTK